MTLFVLSISVILSVIYAILVLCRRIQNRRHYKRIMRRRLRKVAVGTCHIFLSVFLGIVFSWGYRAVVDKIDVLASVEASTAIADGEQTIENNMDTILKLQQTIWVDLSVQERIDVLQTVANIEARYLGISNELPVRALKLDANSQGCYNDGTHEITVNLDCLMDDEASPLLETVCHEAYHSYQYRIVDAYNSADKNSQNLLLFKNVRSYAAEFAHYADGKEDFYSYYCQRCESDARIYAREVVTDYYARIAEYVKGETSWDI